MSAVRTTIKKFRTAALETSEGRAKKEELNPLFVNAQSVLAKAANKGILHKNNVERRIGRLAHLLDSALKGNATAETAGLGVTKKTKKKKRVVKKKPSAS